MERTEGHPMHTAVGLGLTAVTVTVAVLVGAAVWEITSRVRVGRIAKHANRHPAHDDPTLLETGEFADGTRTPWFNRSGRLWGDPGSSAVEYGLLVAALAAAIAGVVFGMGTLVRQQFDRTCSSIYAQVQPGCSVPTPGTGTGSATSTGDNGTVSDETDTGGDSGGTSTDAPTQGQ